MHMTNPFFLLIFNFKMRIFCENNLNFNKFQDGRFAIENVQLQA